MEKVVPLSGSHDAVRLLVGIVALLEDDAHADDIADDEQNAEGVEDAELPVEELYLRIKRREGGKQKAEKHAVREQEEPARSCERAYLLVRGVGRWEYGDERAHCNKQREQRRAAQEQKALSLPKKRSSRSSVHGSAGRSRATAIARGRCHRARPLAALPHHKIHNMPFAPANLTLFPSNPGIAIPNGIHLPCYGPYMAPLNARSLRKLLPKVNMNIVHHMIMFGGRGGGVAPGAKPGTTHLCYQGNIMYAWARTGQTSPIGLDFAETQLDGDGFAVGPGSRFEWFALQVHYQQLSSSKEVMDHSGIELSVQPPIRPLEVQLMASWRLRIPPRVNMDECVACRVTGGGEVVAWRNHAHRLARDIYSEHFSVDGTPKQPLGLISAQQPQIFRILPEPRRIEAGETILLHCMYDATKVSAITYLGVDERTHEMCNQYLMATSGLRLNCAADRTVEDHAFYQAHDKAANEMSAGSLTLASSSTVQSSSKRQTA